MQLINGWLNIGKQWLTYLRYCVDHPMQEPVCRPFWTWIMIGCIGIGVLAVVWFAWKLIDYKLKFAAALKAEAARQYVDVKAIEANRWEGDKAFSGELSPEEIERRAREAVEKRRHEVEAGRDKLNMV